MKNISKIIFFTFLISFSTSYSQEIENDSLRKAEHLYVVVEVEPGYPGGKNKLYKFIENNLNLPSKTDYSSKKILTTFIVEKDGSLSNIKIVKGIDDYVNNQMIEIFKRMPKWKPGIQNGRAVRTQYQLPYTVI